MITVACCVPKQTWTVADKVEWLDKAMRDTECDFFIAPQEYFGGHVNHQNSGANLHIDVEWMKKEMGDLARSHGKALAVGAATRHPSGGATEDYFYFDPAGGYRGYHRKFALPAYDDVRANGAGQLWPEINYNSRVTPITIPDLDLKIGTVFCWEVFSLTIFPAYSMAGCNLIAHPIKFSPRSWPKLSKQADAKIRSIVAYGNDPKSNTWLDKLTFAARHEVMCPIAITCNSWGLGGKHMALTGHVDELRHTTKLIDVPCDPQVQVIHRFDIEPKYYTGLDFSFSAGAFKEHVGDITDMHKLDPFRMHMKVRRLEAQLIGGNTRLDCILKASVQSRQKRSVIKRSRAHARKG
jgi:predicted amidohydrolase